MAHLLTLRLKTGMFDESHIDIINTFEMHLSQGGLFTGKKYVDKICYKVQNIVLTDNDSMNIEQTDESISLGGIQENSPAWKVCAV